jgi:hypothetical protein
MTKTIASIVIASEAKQSMTPLDTMDRFVASLLAMTLNLHRQCSNRVSSQLISFPTISPNSDNITTPANS